MSLQGWSDNLLELMLRHVLRAPYDIPVMLGTHIQKSSLFAAVKTLPLWKEDSLPRKIRSFFRLRWQPDPMAVQRAAKDIFLSNIFGEEGDMGEEMFELMQWCESQTWDFGALTEEDIQKADSLEAFTGLTRMRLDRIRSNPPLNLALFDRFPILVMLPAPMLIRIPVISTQHFLNVHTSFAFNSIRRAKHPHASELIGYLYELLFLQQKIAIALYELLRLSAYAYEKKIDAVLINAEVTAILGADLIFAYLKASIEKTVALVGLAWGIPSLDSKKTHKARIAALNEKLPKAQKETPYGALFLEFVSSSQIEELNTYRTGILHKRGIADLQPHNYASFKGHELPLVKVFTVLHDQHTKNTAALLSGLALVTDRLVTLDPPSLAPEEHLNQMGPAFAPLQKRLLRVLAMLSGSDPEAPANVVEPCTVPCRDTPKQADCSGAP